MQYSEIMRMCQTSLNNVNIPRLSPWAKKSVTLVGSKEYPKKNWRSWLKLTGAMSVAWSVEITMLPFLHY